MRTLLICAVTIALALSVAGCASDPELPSGEPSIRGFITTLTPGAEAETGSVLVETPVGLEVGDYDKASCAINADTALIREGSDGALSSIAFTDLAVGQSVEVWFIGPVAESYPVQATARTLLVRPQ